MAQRIQAWADWECPMPLVVLADWERATPLAALAHGLGPGDGETKADGAVNSCRWA